MPPTLETWQQLLDAPNASLLEQAAACLSARNNSANLNAIAKLRKQFDADLVAAALQLTDARRRAATKFPDRADALLADTEGVEQASSELVGTHKAKRFATVLKKRRADDNDSHPKLFDLCCGIGGDAIAFANAGLNVTAIDADPVRAFMAQHNAQHNAPPNTKCTTQCTTVEAWLDALRGTGDMFHIDPARRTNAGRVWQLADYTPGPAFLREILQRLPDGAIKLGPGVDHDDLADELTDHPDAPLPAHEVEFISEHGRLVQAVLWTGELATQEETDSPIALRRATLLPVNVSIVGSPIGSARLTPLGDIERYLYTVDASVERAELLHILCHQLKLHAIHPALGMLTSSVAIDSPWLTPFAFIEELPWRLKKVKAWLHEHNAGIVEVKTRGKAVNPDQVQQQLRGKGDDRFTVFVLRFDEQIRALVTKRINTSN